MRFALHLNKQVKQKMKFSRKIRINCYPADIWQALTHPKSVAAYMFGSYAKSDWHKGSEISYYLNKDGAEVKIITGFIRECEENTHLRHSLYPLGANYPNKEINHIEVEYLIQEVDNELCELIINQSGFDEAAEGEKRFEHAKAGWDQALPKLKTEIQRIASND